ncbi:MAG TPA: hypothetical protein VF796_13360, partial [Humisphaera sp.]
VVMDHDLVEVDHHRDAPDRCHQPASFPHPPPETGKPARLARNPFCLAKNLIWRPVGYLRQSGGGNGQAGGREDANA